MEDQSLAKNLLYQRKLKGVSQETLAERAGLTVRTIQRIETGAVKPHIQTLKVIADALEVEIKDLLPLENPRQEAIQMNWLLLLHSAPLLGAVVPFANVLVPIFIWLYKRDDNAQYDAHGRAVVNFQLTITLVFIMCFAGLFLPLLRLESNIFFSFLIAYFAVIGFDILFIVLNIIRVLSSKSYFYPLAIPFFNSKWRIAQTNTL